jgi:uncharacterized protein (DUF983 family)
MKEGEGMYQNTKCPKCKHGVLYYTFDKSSDVWVTRCTDCDSEYFKKERKRKCPC